MVQVTIQQILPLGTNHSIKKLEVSVNNQRTSKNTVIEFNKLYLCWLVPKPREHCGVQNYLNRISQCAEVIFGPDHISLNAIEKLESTLN